jgi:hypothetical protein
VLTVTNNAILFSSTINSDATLTPRSLTISAGSGNTTFSGAVGATYVLNALRVNGTVTMGDNITTAGTQNFTGNVIISGSNVNLSSMGNSGTGSTITFGGNIDGSVANSNNLYLLSGAGEISVAGNVGNTTGLGYLALGGYGSYSVPIDVTFSYTGAFQTYVVPTGVTTLTFELNGAQGGSGTYIYGTPNVGANGGRIIGSLSVTAGQTLYLYVGGAGNSAGISNLAGFNGGGTGGNYAAYYFGGGGGGATDIRTSANLRDRLRVAMITTRTATAASNNKTIT